MMVMMTMTMMMMNKMIDLDLMSSKARQGKVGVVWQKVLKKKKKK